MSKKTNYRPVFLNLFQLHFPFNAIVSILHRITGLVLTIALPFVFYTIWFMSTGQEQFEYMRNMLNCCLLSKFSMMVLVWIYTYHVLAGCRHLLMDCGLGLTYKKAHMSAIGLITVFCLAGFFIGVKIWA